MHPPIRFAAFLSGALLSSSLLGAPRMADDAAPELPAAPRSASNAGFSARQFRSVDGVAAATLDSCRGGFETSSGLLVTLGIERIVSVNGVLLAHNELQLGELGSLSSGTTKLAPQAARQWSLIQNGVNGGAAQFGPGVLGGTVIQNSLDNQMIHTATVINASVNAHAALQAMHFQSTLSDALTLAAGRR